MQSITIGDLPFIAMQDSKEALRQQVITMLMTEMKKGGNSVKSDSDWISKKDLVAEFGIEL